MWDNDGYSKGPGGFLDKEGAVLPTFRVTINNVFKAVALFGPALYHQNPNVLVSRSCQPRFRPKRWASIPTTPTGCRNIKCWRREEQQSMRS
jgi:hypothetical protein